MNTNVQKKSPTALLCILPVRERQQNCRRYIYTHSTRQIIALARGLHHIHLCSVVDRDISDSIQQARVCCS